MDGQHATELKLKDAAKAMGKLFACGASVSDTASGGKEIVIQGDVLDPLAAMLEDKFQVREGRGTKEEWRNGSLCVVAGGWMNARVACVGVGCCVGLPGRIFYL